VEERRASDSYPQGTDSVFKVLLLQHISGLIQSFLKSYPSTPMLEEALKNNFF